MSDTIIDRLHSEFASLVACLDAGAQPSLCIAADENFRKALLLASASYFERRICEEILWYVEEVSGQNRLVSNLVRNKAIRRKYHEFFDWDGSNGNAFFALFGESFKEFMRKEMDGDPDLCDAVKAFLEIGRERNRLVHQDYATYTLEKTADEIYRLYQTALMFIEAIPLKLRSCPMAFA